MPNIYISDDQKAMLAELTQLVGQREEVILQEALSSYAKERMDHLGWHKLQSEKLAELWDNDDDAVYDRL